jgi:hypothetical protein
LSNDIRIGVSADTNNTTSGLSNVEKGAKKVVDSVKQIDEAAKKAGASLQRLEAIAAILSKEMGKAINPKQAEEFLRNFENIRTNRNIPRGSAVRQFGSFEDWHAKNHSLFVNQGDADAYKRRVYGIAGRNLPGFNQAPGAPPPPPRVHGSGAANTPGYGYLQPSYGAAASSGMGGLKMAAGAGLALAGITSVMAMAGRAVDLARQESTSTDQLLRSVGDLDKTFDDLRSRVRASGDGLGVLYTESAALAKQYAKINGGDGGDIGGNVRTGFGLARGYGLELGEGVGFMAQARHFGQIGVDDKDGRKFALLIAESIEKGGNTSKAGEVLTAISSFSSQVARLALTAPNAGGFAGALAGLTSMHTPGLDPANASSMLMQVDSSIRQGGGMGEAGLNFTYGALSRAMPGIDPIMAKAVMEQGAFGSGVSPQVAEYAKRNGIKTPKFTGQDNLSLMLGQLDRQYGNSMAKLDATKNVFGLSSLSQAAALSNMDRKKLGGLQNLVGSDISTLSASGIQNVARIGSADDGELKQIAARLMKDDRLTDTEKGKISKDLAGGNMEDLRSTMAKAVAVREQEKNVGTETRDAVAELNNTLTKIGGQILPIISGIQEGVSAMAAALSPSSDYAKKMKLQEGLGAYQAQKVDLIAGHIRQIDNLDQSLDARGITGPRREQAIKNLKDLQAEEVYKFTREHEPEEKLLQQKAAVPTTEGGAASDANGALDLGPLDESAASDGGAQIGKVNFTAEELKTLEKGAGGDPRKLSMMKRILAVENRGFGKLNYSVNSPKGAAGPFQIMPDTASEYGVKDPNNLDDAADGMSRFIGFLGKKYNWNEQAMFAHYNGGTKAGEAVADGGKAPAAETRDYLTMADGLTGNVPGGGSGGSSEPLRLEVNLNGTITASGGHDKVGEFEPHQATFLLPMAAGARK